MSNLVKKPDYNTKINEIESTPEFDKLTTENFVARLKQENLASKSDIANFVKRQNLIINYQALIKELTRIKQSM